MKLFVSAPSPFARKVLVAAQERGISLEQVHVKQTPLAPDAAVAAHNPLGKIPALRLDDGSVLYDSRVICEYLDTLGAAPPLVPAGDRFRVLRVQALADGILDAAVAVRYEHALRPRELHWQPWIDAQLLKVRQGLTQLAAEHVQWHALDLGVIAVACTLGWLEFRKVLPTLRADYPALYAWYDTVCARPAFAATIPRE